MLWTLCKRSEIRPRFVIPHVIFDKGYGDKVLLKYKLLLDEKDKNFKELFSDEENIKLYKIDFRQIFRY